MSKPKVTEWYSGEVKPCSDEKHIGLYDRLYDDGKAHKCYWTGSYFSVFLERHEWEDDFYRLMPSVFQDEMWRGLTEPSK